MAQYQECPDCGNHLDHGEPCDCKEQADQSVQSADTDGPGEVDDDQQPAYLSEIHCMGCGKSAAELGEDPIAGEDTTYNADARLFLCYNCWVAAGQPEGMVQPDGAAETGLIVRPVQAPEVINPDVLFAPPADEEDVPQDDTITYTCKYCGQSSFTPGCSCDGAEAEKRREAAERGREEAYRDIAELLFPRFIERDDEGYKSEPNYKMYVAVIDRVIDGGIAKATIDIDCENKVAITVKDYQVQMQLTRTIKTAKTASVA